MKIKILTILLVTFLFLFLIGCTSEELTPNEEKELESELQELSDEELDQLIEDTEKSPDALVGKGHEFNIPERVNKKGGLLGIAYKVKAIRCK